jgi:transposase-like protein
MYSRSAPRRRHGAEFKAKVLADCDEPGASISGVTLTHGLNANLVRQWRAGGGAQPASVSVTAPSATKAPRRPRKRRRRWSPPLPNSSRSTCLRFAYSNIQAFQSQRSTNKSGIWAALEALARANERAPALQRDLRELASSEWLAPPAYLRHVNYEWSDVVVPVKQAAERVARRRDPCGCTLRCRRPRWAPQLRPPAIDAVAACAGLRRWRWHVGAAPRSRNVSRNGW